MTTSQISAAAFAAGIGFHLFILRKGEWHLWALRFILAPCVAYPIITILLATTGQPQKSLLGNALDSMHFISAFLVGVLGSIFTYRALFHRLSKNGIPGPFAARLSQLYFMRLNSRDRPLFAELDSLHDIYGDYVRIGPTEISIADPKAVALIYGTNMKSGKVLKGPWYDIRRPRTTLQLTRDVEEHSKRRKLWDKAFNSKALHSYEHRVESYTSQLLNAFEEHENQAFDVSKWFHYFAFDLMGDMAFGESFRLMENDGGNYFYEKTREFLPMLAPISALPWLPPLLNQIPLLNKRSKDVEEFIMGMFKHRLLNEPEEPDVFHWISSEYRNSPDPTKQETLNMLGDAELIVFAGSETTASVLSCLWYNLANNSEVYQKLQTELDRALLNQPNSKRTWTNESLSKLEYLQACIDESLRFMSLNPSGMQRQTGPEGLQIGDRWIPENINVRVLHSRVNRDSRAFPHGDEYIPERWTTRRDELVRDASAHIPFSAGRYSCVGKQLGLMTVRRATALIAQRYDIRFAREESRKEFVMNLEDHITLGTPPLELILTTRQNVKV